MNGNQSRTSRRAFFRGSVALGAGVATAGATGLMGSGKAASDDQLQQLQDCEAIRQLQQDFATMLETRSYDAAGELFDDQASLELSGLNATGRAAIQQLFAQQYRHQTAEMIHSVHRQHSLQQPQAITFGQDRLRAKATWHVDVALSSPLPGESTEAIMARLQGNMASRRWESGRLEATYVKTQDQWKISSLTYVTV